MVFDNKIAFNEACDGSFQKEIYIWGAGHYGVLTAFNYEQEGIKIKAFIDINANKIKTRLGLPVLTPEQVLINNATIKPYIIVSVENQNAACKITEFLQKNCLKENEDYEYSKLIPWARIRNYFLQLDRQNQPEEIKEIIDFFQKNLFSIFPYEFIHKYKLPEVLYDNDYKMHYVLHKGKKLYMPSAWNENECANYYKDLCIEQDVDSPHRYEVENYMVKEGDVIVDIGAAEGIWALENVEKASKMYLFECEEKWIEALQKTFEPYNEKVEIINKFISNVTDGNEVTFDDFFNGHKINFVKTDIEGTEREFLQGAKNILQNQNDIKLLLCTYHREKDEIVLKEILEKYGFATEYSKGYMIYSLYSYDRIFKEPYIRRGLIRARKCKQ
jgi:hypothetical protein